MTYQLDYGKYGILLGSIGGIIIGVASIAIALFNISTLSYLIYTYIKHNVTIVSRYIGILIIIIASIFLTYLGILFIRAGFQYKNLKNIEYTLINAGTSTFSIMLILYGIGIAILSNNVSKGIYLIISGVLFLIGSKTTLIRNVLGPILVIAASIVLGFAIGFNSFTIGIILISIAIFLKLILEHPFRLVNIFSIIIACIGTILVGSYFVAIGNVFFKSTSLMFGTWQVVMYLGYLRNILPVIGALFTIGGISILLSPIFITVNQLINSFQYRPRLYRYYMIMQQYITCPKCGTQVPSDYNYCPRCGYKLK